MNDRVNKTDYDLLLEGVKLKQQEKEYESEMYSEVKFYFNLIFKGVQCFDEYLQEFCNKVAKKLYEMPEIQKMYPNFEDFDNLIDMSLVDYGVTDVDSYGEEILCSEADKYW